MSFLTFSIMPIYLMFIVGIPILIGIYVYRDANRRNMNAPLWTLVAVLAPTFIGFIIYLIVRSGYSDLRCANCGASVQDSYTVCPRCGTRLKATCKSCGFPVEPDWTVCPRCAASLSAGDTDFTPPIKPQDKGLGKILVIILLIPVLLLGSTLFFFSVARHNYGGSTRIHMENHSVAQVSETI